MPKLIFHLPAIVLFLILQVGFLPTLGGPLGDFNLALGTVIFIAAVFNRELALGYGLGLGAGLEIFAASPYGLILVNLILTVLLIDWLLKHLFTNRSFYSLTALALIGVNFYYLAALAGNHLLYFLKVTELNIELNSFYFRFLGWQNVAQLVLAVFAFVILNLVSRRFKTVFLRER